MNPADYPTDERLRVEELSRYCVLLDSPEQQFTELARLATIITGTSLGGVSLVDDSHVWLKARVGVDATCLSREQAFCSYAVESNQEIFVVENALDDPRFSSNALVHKDPNIRFYAAATLAGARGFRLGTLWIMDTQPRQLSDIERTAMLGLAAQVVRLLELSYRNQYSNLPNRSAFVSNLQCAINQQRTGSQVCRIGDCVRLLKDGTCLSNLTRINIVVGFIHIRNRHLVTSAHGKEFGNQMVISLSERIRQWAAADAMIAHLEGDSFAFALFDSSSAFQEKIIELDTLLSSPLKVRDTLIQLSCSIGISRFPDAGINASSLLEQAAAAATQSHEMEMTGTRIRAYEKEHHAQTLELIAFQQTVAAQNLNTMVVPNYQAQVDAVHGKVVGFEALVRMQHPKLGRLAPNQFLPLVEKSGMIAQLDLAMLKGVCTDLKRWLDKGLAVLPVAVNFARTTLLQNEMPKNIAEMLHNTGIPPNLIKIEITEGGLSESPEIMRRCVEALHDLGLKIAVDDFGTGLSNLSTLQSYTFDQLKADRAYVHGASTNAHVGGILRFIENVSRLFHVELICEGVEEQEDLQWAMAIGCQIFQGWYFHQATDADAVARILAALPAWHNSTAPLLPGAIAKNLHSLSAESAIS